MSLVRAERRRFFKRRLTRWVFPIGLLLLVTIASILFAFHSKPTAEARAKGETAAEAMYQEQVRYYEQYKRECGEKCPEDGWTGPQRSDFRAEDFMPPSFDFKAQYGELFLVWAAIMAMVAFLLGASFVGAEWASGSMMNLLTWRPKRMKVLGTKLAVMLVSVAALSILALGVWTGILWAAGELRGTTEGLTPGVWQSFGLTALRGLGMILAFAALGFGLASVGRHTGLALGAALAVVIVGQVGLSILFQMVRVPFWEQYLVPVHIFAWMNKEVKLVDFSSPETVCDTAGRCNPPELLITWQNSGSIALGLIAVVLVLAFWQMRRRDIS